MMNSVPPTQRENYSSSAAPSCVSFLSDRGGFTPFLELDHLRISIAQPEYLLAMKCLSFRIGAEFHDEDDVRYLLRHLDVGSCDQALAIIARYYPLKRFPQKTLHALSELLPPP